MPVVFAFLILFSQEAFSSSFSPDIRLCAWPMTEGSEKFLLFNFKTRSQVMIKLEGEKVRDLGRGPYLFELKIHDPQYKKSEYRADLITAKLCDPKEAVRFVNGELSGVR